MQLLGRKSKLVFTHDSHVEVIIYLYGLTGNQPVILMHFGLHSIPPLRCRSALVWKSRAQVFFVRFDWIQTLELFQIIRAAINILPSLKKNETKQ